MSLLRTKSGLFGALCGLLLAGGLAGGLAAPAAAAGPVTVSLTFHDGLSNQYRNARPVLRAHGVNGTFYVASNFMLSTDPNYMRFYDLDNLYREGDEIGSMGRDHQDLTATYDPDPAADLAYKTDQVCGDRTVLRNLGYDPFSFAYPGGAVNSVAESIVSGCGYTSGRLVGGLATSGGPDAEPIPPVDPFVLRAMSSADPITLTELQTAVNTAGAGDGGWLPIAIGNVCRSSDSSYATCMNNGKAIDADVLSQFLDWAQSPDAPAGTTVRTVRDVMSTAAPPPLPNRPTTVSLTFDDGLRSQYPIGANLAAHHDKATFYINSGPVDLAEPGTMTWAQIHDLADQGNDIGGHTTDHVDMTASGTTFAQKWSQACDDRARLFQQGFNPVAFAYPVAAFNPTAESIVSGCGYQSGRSGGTISAAGPNYAESVPPRDAYAFWALGTTYDGPITLAVLQDAVNAAAGHGGGWVPMLFHEICYPTESTFGTCMAGYRPVSAAVLEDFLTWLDGQAGNGVSVRSVTDVMNNGATPPRVVVTSPSAGSLVTSTPATLRGTAASGGGDVTARLYAGPYSTGAPLAVLNAPQTSGAWSVQTDALPDGTYTVQASQQAGGLTGTSPPVRFTVGPDVTAPTVTIAQPAVNARVGATFTVSGSAGTATGDNGTVRVEVRPAATPSGPDVSDQSVTVAADGSWSTPVSGLPDGNYVVVASQRDQAGNTGTVGPRAFTVDGAAPTVTLTQPAAGARLRGTVTLAGTAGIATGDPRTVRVQIWSGATPTGTAVVDKTATVAVAGGWTTTAAGLVAGDYVVTVSQTDTAGNTGSAGPVAFTIDNTAPTVTITQPAANGRVGPGSVAMTGTAGAGAGDNSTVRVVVRLGCRSLGPRCLRPDRAGGDERRLDSTVPGMTEGGYTVTVTQGDQAGNTRSVGPRAFTVDATAPSVSITSPTDGSSSIGTALTVRGTGTRGTGDVATATLEVHPGTDASAPPIREVNGAISTAGAWTANVTGLTPGEYTLVARQSDSAGNVGRSAPVHVTMQPTMTISGLSPATVGRGATARTMTLTGANLRTGTTATVSGSGVTVTSATVNSDTSMTLVVSATAAAATGARNVVLTSTGQPNVTCTGCLTVTASPRVTALTQRALAAGLTGQALTANGTGFTADTQLTITGPGVTATITARTATTLALNVDVAADAPLGARDVVVTNSDGGTTTCVGCFTVAAPPTITAVSPVTVRRGATVTATITGTGFDSTLRWTVDLTGVTLSAPTYVSPTTFTVSVRATATAALVGHALTASSTASRGTASLANAITVVP